MVAAPPNPPDDEDGGEQRDALKQWLRDMRSDVDRAPDPAALRVIDEILKGQPRTDPYAKERNELDLADRKTILSIKRRLARWAGGFAAGQLVLADLLFAIYAIYHGWHFPYQVMVAWLSATVVETVGIVYIIARHVFPNRDSSAK